MGPADSPGVHRLRPRSHRHRDHRPTSAFPALTDRHVRHRLTPSEPGRPTELWPGGTRTGDPPNVVGATRCVARWALGPAFPSAHAPRLSDRLRWLLPGHDGMCRPTWTGPPRTARSRRGERHSAASQRGQASPVVDNPARRRVTVPRPLCDTDCRTKQAVPE